MPYFSYLSMLFFYETLGWWSGGAEVRRVHFAEVRYLVQEETISLEAIRAYFVGHAPPPPPPPLNIRLCVFLPFPPPRMNLYGDFLDTRLRMFPQDMSLLSGPEWRLPYVSARYSIVVFFDRVVLYGVVPWCCVRRNTMK